VAGERVFAVKRSAVASSTRDLERRGENGNSPHANNWVPHTARF